jgi:hypothetical protein
MTDAGRQIDHGQSPLRRIHSQFKQRIEPGALNVGGNNRTLNTNWTQINTNATEREGSTTGRTFGASRST